MLSVRLSEDEYRELKSLCVAGDARSVSDVARKAMQALLNNGPSSLLDPQLQALHTRVDRLDLEVSRIVQILSTAKQ